MVQLSISIDLLFESLDFALIETKKRVDELNSLYYKHLRCIHIHCLIDFPRSPTSNQASLNPLDNDAQYFRKLSLVAHEVVFEDLRLVLKQAL